MPFHPASLPSSLPPWLSACPSVSPQRVYQFHKDKEGVVKEEHVLGRYSPSATAAASKRDQAVAGGINLEATRAWREQWQLRRAASKHSSGATGGDDDVKPPPAPPMLELLDYLPDTGERD